MAEKKIEEKMKSWSSEEKQQSPEKQVEQEGWGLEGERIGPEPEGP